MLQYLQDPRWPEWTLGLLVGLAVIALLWALAVWAERVERTDLRRKKIVTSHWLHNCSTMKPEDVIAPGLADVTCPECIASDEYKIMEDLSQVGESGSLRET